MILTLCGSSAAASPVANFTSNVTNGTTPLSVQFNDSSTGNVSSWNWNFGDVTYPHFKIRRIHTLIREITM